MSDAKTNTDERAFGEETLASAICAFTTEKTGCPQSRVQNHENVTLVHQ